MKSNKTSTLAQIQRKNQKKTQGRCRNNSSQHMLPNVHPDIDTTLTVRNEMNQAKGIPLIPAICGHIK